MMTEIVLLNSKSLIYFCYHYGPIDIIEKWELSIRFVDIEAKSLSNIFEIILWMLFTNR